jgi:folate-binding protein YgfZ
MGGVGTQPLSGEDAVVRTGCGVLDRSERGKLALSGAGSVEFLNGQVTNELLTLAPGEGAYAAFLTHKGKMLGDMRILAAGDGAVGELLLDTERVALQALFDMIRRFKVGYDVELHKRTLESALLSLIGPDADEVLGAVAETLPGPTEHDHVSVHAAGIDVRLVRTDVGIDLLCDSSGSERMLGLLGEHGAHPVSEQAAETLRVERGRPRFGIDIDDSTIPQEAGLNDRAVNFTKGCYVGQETVARLFYKGKPNRHLRGLRLTASPSPGDELRLGERVVGRLGTVAESPALGTIALALVRREAEPGSSVDVGPTGAAATVVELPFRVST